MLSLADSRWKQIHGGYRVPFDASVPLSRLESGAAVWNELWQGLHHQGDVGEASYAAVPHLVRIARASGSRDWNVYALVALIEVDLHRKKNPPLPEWLRSDYESAWRDIAILALEDLANSSDPFTVQSALSVVAIARGQLKLGALLCHFDESEVSELAEDMLAWSQSYASGT